MEDQVIDFIDRRFKKDCHWLDGNCYWFANILCNRFVYLEIYYDTIKGHFYAVDELAKKAYDFNGVHDFSTFDLMKVKNLSKLYYEDIRLYDRLRRDCID